jgi:hypothetical protein
MVDLLTVKSNEGRTRRVTIRSHDRLDPDLERRLLRIHAEKLTVEAERGRQELAPYLHRAFLEALAWYQSRGEKVTKSLLWDRIPRDLFVFADADGVEWLFRREIQEDARTYTADRTVEDVMYQIRGTILECELDNDEYEPPPEIRSRQNTTRL